MRTFPCWRLPASFSSVGGQIAVLSGPAYCASTADNAAAPSGNFLSNRITIVGLASQFARATAIAIRELVPRW